ncbi:hypothetical protein JW905_09880 [bacterium]|nr:hypothetical protein [candidate division CSSED10-310 bacterium]
MNIAYLEPLAKSFDRMKKALFKPFDAGKWFVVGFTAWLAGLLSSGFNFSGGNGGSIGDLGDLGNGFHQAVDWLGNHPGWVLLIIALVLLGMAVVVVLTWLSSRGRFLFLDNVVHDRALVKEPWQKFKAQGNSLFAFRICFGLAVFLFIVAYLVAAFLIGASVYASAHDSAPFVLTVLALVMCLLPFILITVYITFFLDKFVVPLMYQNEIKVMAAWREFFGILRLHPLHFLLFGLFFFCLRILIFSAVIITGCLTCCLLFLFLLIPYIGAVVALPVSYTLRALSLEYLDQFGPEYRIFPAAVEEID